MYNKELIWHQKSIVLRLKLLATLFDCESFTLVKRLVNTVEAKLNLTESQTKEKLCMVYICIIQHSAGVLCDIKVIIKKKKYIKHPSKSDSTVNGNLKIAKPGLTGRS